MGLQSVGKIGLGIFGIGLIIARFQLSGKMRCEKDELIMLVKGFEMC